MKSAFTPGCGYDNSTIILIGDVSCPNTKCSGRLCLHKKTFHSLGRSDYQSPQCGSVCQVRNNLFEDQTNSFFVAWSRGLHFWREPKISSRCSWRCLLSWQVLFQQREMRIYWRLCNNSEIHLLLWKVWSLVVFSQSSFYVTRARKDDKNGPNTFFLCKKKMNLVPNKQLLLNVPFQSTKYGKKELCVDNKVRETIGDVYCPTCRNEKCVYISTNKTTSFYDGKNFKACCNVLNILLKDQKPTIFLFGCDGTHCFARKTSRHYENQKPSPFLKKFLRQSQPSTSEPEPKKVKMSPNKE